MFFLRRQKKRTNKILMNHPEVAKKKKMNKYAKSKTMVHCPIKDGREKQNKNSV